MDALSFLRADHESVLGMFEVLDGAPKGTGALEDGYPGEADYHEALAEFITAGREHIAFEQQQVWPQFAAAVGEAEMASLGEKLEVAKKVAPTRPHPDTPPNPLVQKTMGTAAAVVDHVRDTVSGRAGENPPDPQSH